MNWRQHRSLQFFDGEYIRIYFSRTDFEDGLERYALNSTEENFSTFWDGAATTDLSVGENDVGLFDIIIDNDDINATVGTVEAGDDNEGVFSATYEKDVTEIKFENFEEERIYAFGAKWDIDQDFNDYFDDDGWWSQRGNSKDAAWDDDWEGGGWNGHGDKWGKMLHIKLGREGFNLLDMLYHEDTNFIGFIAPKGFTYAEIFAPKSEEPIGFVMSEVIISVGEPTSPPSFFETTWEIILEVYEFLISVDYSGLIEFFNQIFGGSGEEDSGED